VFNEEKENIEQVCFVERGIQLDVGRKETPDSDIDEFICKLRPLQIIIRIQVHYYRSQYRRV